MGISTPRDLTIPFVVDHPQEPENCRYRNLYDAIKTTVSLTHGRWQSVDLSGVARRKRSLHSNEPGIVGADTTALALPQIPTGSVTAGPVEIDLHGVANDAVSSDSATGGAIVGTATLQLLFWGGFWEKAFAPSTGDIRITVAALLNSPYLSQLDQYGFKSLVLGASTLVYADVPAPTFSNEDAYNMVWDLIDQDTFPEPDDTGGRNIYMVFAPAGTQNDNANARGAHSDPKDTDVGDVDRAWVGWINHGSLDFISQVFSHELVEILTDPEPNSGYQMNRSLNGGTEIGDACNNTGARAEGILLQGYWSERHKACVVPRRAHSASIVRSDPDFDLIYDHVTEHKQLTLMPGPLCPEGTYCYKRHARWEAITFTAVAHRYNSPKVAWTLNGKAIPSNSSGSVVFMTDTWRPEPTGWSHSTAPVTVGYQTTGMSLLVTNNPSDANYGFEVRATITENGPADPTATATVTTNDGFQGQDLQWDDQFIKDRQHCLDRLKRANEKARTGPVIDHGDPYRPWIDHLPPVYNEQTRGELRELGRIAHYAERADPDFAAALRSAAETFYQVPSGALRGTTAHALRELQPGSD
jgi:hypothetical protein